MILHLDMDCFYVSVERLLDPALVGRPVAVGGSPDGRGVVASASYEARRHGVRSAMPMATALRLCPGLVVIRGSMSRYAEYSAAVAAILREFTPLVQMASQDEAYLDMAGTERLWGPVAVAADRLRRRVTAETRLPCSVGVGINKVVAKIASDLCKPAGYLYIPEGSEERFLAPLPVGRLPGVGERTRERLQSEGIRRIGQIPTMTPAALERHFGNRAAAMVARARGTERSAIVVDEPPKSIGAEETFDHDQVAAEPLDAALSTLAERVAARLRAEPCLAQCLTLKYRYSDFETHTAAVTLPSPTNDDRALLDRARELLAAHRQPGRALRLLGLTASALVFGEYQDDVFEAPTRQRRDRLNAALDTLRERHGFSILRRASSRPTDGPETDKKWG
jgi:DNA polymerase-4